MVKIFHLNSPVYSVRGVLIKSASGEDVIIFMKWYVLPEEVLHLIADRINHRKLTPLIHKVIDFCSDLEVYSNMAKSSRGAPCTFKIFLEIMYSPEEEISIIIKDKTADLIVDILEQW